MKNLNRTWLTLIVFGIIFLLGFVIYSFIQAVTTIEFREVVNEFSTNTLISNSLETHLRQDPDFSGTISQ